MCGGGDPGGPVDVEPDVIVTAHGSLTRVDPHPHPDRRLWRPGVCGHGSLRLRRRRQGRERGPERREERITHGPDVDTAGVADGTAEQTVVVLENRPPPRSKRLEHPCGAFDVREEEGDGSGRQLAHVLGERKGWSDGRGGLVTRRRVRSREREIPSVARTKPASRPGWPRVAP